MSPDHIHLLLSVPPTYLKHYNILKGKAVYKNLSHYVNDTGVNIFGLEDILLLQLNSEEVQRYIEEQQQ